MRENKKKIYYKLLYLLDSAAAYCLNFLPSRLVPFGPLTDNMLLKTDKSMVGPVRHTRGVNKNLSLYVDVFGAGGGSRG